MSCSTQYLSAVAKSWSDSPYMFIVRFQTQQPPGASRGGIATGDGDAAIDSSDPLSITSKVHVYTFWLTVMGK